MIIGIIETDSVTRHNEDIDILDFGWEFVYGKTLVASSCLSGLSAGFQDTNNDGIGV